MKFETSDHGKAVNLGDVVMKIEGFEMPQTGPTDFYFWMRSQKNDHGGLDSSKIQW